jgi:hypothetical protein
MWLQLRVEKLGPITFAILLSGWNEWSAED